MDRLFIALAAFGASLSLSLGAQNITQLQPTKRFPAGLLERVSSGGLMRLDRNGDLVAPPRTSVLPERSSSGATESAEGVALDPRVGANIRLGDDPPVLSGQRAQAEPHIMRSRTNLDLVVATFQEGRYAQSGGAIDCGFATSTDGGLTWSRALLPGVTQAVGGPYFRATDPVVGIDLNNRAFINMDAATDTNFDHGDVIVSRSVDSGATFESPVVVYHGTNQNFFADKNWMAVNTFSGTATPAGRVLVTFTLFTNFSSNSSPSPLVAYYSDDAGQTWIPSNGSGFITPATSHMQGSQPLFLPNGRVALVYWNFTQASIPNSIERMEVITSDDGGATFNPTPHVIGHVNQWFEPSIRSGSFLPSAATDRTAGNLYVVVQGNLGSDAAPDPKILFTKSTDGGQTWSALVPISDNPTGSGVFNPAITASPDGQTLTVAFYDRRNNPGTTTLVDMYEAQSFDGGATWQPNIRLTSVSSDVTLAPNTGTADSPAYMLGDYLGVAEPTNRSVPAIPVFVDTRTGNPDPFVVRVGVAPSFDFTSWQAARLSLAQIQAPQYGLKQLNISTRVPVGLGGNALIGGFIVTGSDAKKVLIRGLGPSLTSLGVTGALQDPVVELHDEGGALIISNDNWQETQSSEIQQTGIPPSDTRESAIVRTVTPGKYTAVLRGQGNSTGVGLVEVYDLAQTANSQLGNISTRGSVESGGGVMIGGFIIGGGTGPSGTGSAKIVVRALGPSLTAKGVANALQDPTLELHDVNGTAIFGDDNWKDIQASEIQATKLAPTDNRESAIVALVPPGNYTAILRGNNNATGIGLVEVYNLQ
jgi:hypothetical protein